MIVCHHISSAMVIIKLIISLPINPFPVVSVVPRRLLHQPDLRLQDWRSVLPCQATLAVGLGDFFLKHLPSGVLPSGVLPSGKLSKNYGKIQPFSGWENPLFLW